MTEHEILGYTLDTEDPDSYIPQPLESAAVYSAFAVLLFWLAKTEQEHTRILASVAVVMLIAAAWEILETANDEGDR